MCVSGSCSSFGKSSQSSRRAITAGTVLIPASNTVAVDPVSVSTSMAAGALGTVWTPVSNSAAVDPVSTSIADVSVTTETMLSKGGDSSPICFAAHGDDSPSICEIALSERISLENCYESAAADKSSSSTSMMASPDVTDSFAIGETITNTFICDPVSGSTQSKRDIDGRGSKPVLDIVAVQPAFYPIVNTFAHASGQYATHIGSPVILPTMMKGGEKFIWITDRDFVVEPTIKIIEVGVSVSKKLHKKSDTTLASILTGSRNLRARFRAARRFRKCSNNIYKTLSMCVTHIRSLSKVKDF
ncbi:hypothetical protein R1flu_024296 [Riccia fluitans]|uniref:Uncharacterized protein n=1 Tax=Riccia fluitans TaxID=41844 RepID=A0ABD1XUH1_9MARC